MARVTIKLDAYGSFRYGPHGVGRTFPYRGRVHANLSLPRWTVSVNGADVAELVDALEKRGIKVIQETV